jgi:cell wall-associated NlpC family hydrolase
MSLTSTVSDHVTGIGRGGVVLAMSSGLVASIGMPAGAGTRDSSHTGLVSHPAAVVESPAMEQAFAGVSASLTSGEPLTAPATATLTFDRSSFTAVPRPAPAPTPAVSRSTARVGLTTGASTSRSTSRSSTKSTTTGESFGSARGSSVIAVAARYVGVPYRYGGSTPRGFDCSGYTQYVFAQLGVRIPRTADQQYHAVTRISSSQARAGDLVFFLGSGGAYHVGIYAGGGMMYDAGRSGQLITKRDIWSADIAFGRP